MHYSNLVIVDISAAQASLEAAVEEAMGPHKDDGGFWDWYQIGGRWAGTFDGYEPHKDPANVETCNLCAGTGKRTDMSVADGCNGCNGTGIAEKWPTQWKQHPGDVIPIENLTEEMLNKFFRVCVHTEEYGSDIWGGEKYAPWAKGESAFLKLPFPPLTWLQENFKGCVAIVVDNHS